MVVGLFLKKYTDLKKKLIWSTYLKMYFAICKNKGEFKQILNKKVVDFALLEKKCI